MGSSEAGIVFEVDCECLRKFRDDGGEEACFYVWMRGR